MKFQSEIKIQASANQTWEVLTNITNWPKWDPHCERIEGELKLGQKIKVFTKLSPGRAFPVKVDLLDAPFKMIWKGGMPFGLFQGVRTYELKEISESSCHFSMEEVFSGPMLGLIKGSIPDMTQAFDDFAQGLKKETEEN